MDTSFTHRPKNEFERYVDSYEGFVEDAQSGYTMCLDEYTADLYCRTILEDNKGHPEVVRMWGRVERADQRLRGLLLPTTRCIYGDYPPSCFWLWGYPPGSAELEADLRRRGMLW